jgi:CubicO group peptidase (beta-lactamase class C family)
MERVRAALADHGPIPGVAVSVWWDGAEVFCDAAGYASVEPTLVPCLSSTAFDLASLTKALVGATVTASLLASGALRLDAPVRRWFPSFDPRARVAHLLDHSSGLPPWRALWPDRPWGTNDVRSMIIEDAASTPTSAAPGDRHAYSDLGFLTLLGVVERAGGDRIDALFHDRIAKPCGLIDLSWGWPEAAATERCPVRGAVVRGTVHDLNCAAMGGVSSHAGLFGTASAVARLADLLRQAASGAPSPLPGPTLATMWAHRGPGSHRLGFDSPTPGGSTGDAWPPDSVGHLGYTGTSVWIAPSRGVTVALLTNRVHPIDGDRAPIQDLRRRVHRAVAHDFGWNE